MMNFNNPQSFAFFKTALSRLNATQRNATQRNATQRKFKNTSSVNRLFQAKTYTFLLTTFIAAFNSEFMAQAVNGLIKDVVMPSAHASSLGKHGGIPVSYYTGVPNVGIPIHTLQQGAISLLISLSLITILKSYGAAS